MPRVTDAKSHPWQDTIRQLKEERHEEASTPRRVLPPRSSSPRRVPGQSARPPPAEVDYTNYSISSSRRRPRVGIFRAASPYDGSSAMESNMDSLELALQDTSKTSSSTVSTTSRSPYRSNGHDTSQDTCSTETELEQLQHPPPSDQEISPPTRPPRRSYPTAYSPNPTNPFASSPGSLNYSTTNQNTNTFANAHTSHSGYTGHITDKRHEHGGHDNRHLSTDSPASAYDPFSSDMPSEYGGDEHHTVTSSQETSAASSSQEDPRFRGKMGLHILCAEATSQNDIAWRNALYLLGMQPPLAQVVDSDGRTALHVACEGNTRVQRDKSHSKSHPTAPPSYMIRALLVANVAAARQPDRDGRLPIHCLAASSGDVDGLQILVETYPASITVRDAGGWTPLQLFLQNTLVLVTMAQAQILLGMTLPPTPQEQANNTTSRHRIRLRRGDHLKLKVEHLDQMLQETNPVYDPLRRYKIPEEVLNSYQEDIRVCLKRLVQWDKKQQRQKKQQQQTQNTTNQDISHDEEKEDTFMANAVSAGLSLEDESGETNPAAMASPTDRRLPLHMLVCRGMLDINLQRRHSDPSSPPTRDRCKKTKQMSPRQAHQQSLIILVRLLVGAFPEALITRDSAGHTPLMLAMLSANTEILPSQELLELLLGKRTAGFESLPSWAEDVPYPSQNIYRPPYRNRLSAAAERYTNPAMVATLDTCQLPLHIAAEEFGDNSSLMVAVYESYPGAIHVQDARGRMPLHILLQNYRRVTPHPQVVALLLSDRVAQTTSDEGHLPFDLLVESSSCLPLEPECEPLSRHGSIAHPDPFKAFRQFFQASIIAATAKTRASHACHSRDALSTDSSSFRRRRSESQLFLCRLRTLPPWLRRQACSVPFVQELLLDELASPGKCAYILTYGVFLALLLYTFRRQTDTYMEKAHTLASVPEGPDNATFFNGSGEEVLNSFVYVSPERYDPWNTLAVYGLSAGLVCFQATFWACSWFLNEFQQLCLFNFWKWIEFLAVVSAVLTTAMIHESFPLENVLAVGTAATGLLWFSIVGYLSSWWYEMAFFTGALMNIARMLLWPTFVAAILLVGFAEMFYTLGHIDCNSTQDDLSICNLREAYQLAYFLVLGEPIFDVSDVHPIRPGMGLLVALFTTFCFLFFLGLIVVIVVVASKCDAETHALDSYWEPKLAFVLSSQDSRTLAGHQTKARASQPSSLDRLATKLEELWNVAMSLVSGRNKERYWYARGSSLLEKCCLKLIAAVLIPLWVVAGTITLGFLWPPQLRRFLFEPRVWIHRGDHVNPNEAKDLLYSQVSDVRNEVCKLKAQSYDQSNDVHNEIQELKALLLASMKDK